MRGWVCRAVLQWLRGARELEWLAVRVRECGVGRRGVIDDDDDDTRTRTAKTFFDAIRLRRVRYDTLRH